MATITRNRKRAFYSSKTLIQYRQYASFDGVNDYIGIPWNSGFAALAQSFSIRARVRLNTLSAVSGSIQTIVANGLGASTNLFFDLKYHTTPKSFRSSIRNTSGTQFNFDATTVIQTGIWYDVAVTFSSVNNKAEIYVNGIKEGTITTTGTLNNSAQLNTRIGISSPDDNYLIGPFSGDIDLVEIYNRVLSSGEIVNGGGNALCLHNLNNSTNDSSGNNNHGVAYNGVTFAQEQI